MPAGIYNRAADNWRPLLAIAEVAGGKWPERAKAAALASVAADIDDAALLELLLGDIRDIFAKQVANEIDSADRIPSAALAEALAEIEGRPWAEYGKNDRPLTQNKLARMLKELKPPVVPQKIGPKTARVSGYVLADFKDAFERFLPEEASQPDTRTPPFKTSTSDNFEPDTPETGCPVGKREKPYSQRPVSGCPVEKGETGEASEVCDYCGRPGGNEVSFSDGPTARLHRECEAQYRRRLDDEEPANDA